MVLIASVKLIQHWIRTRPHSLFIRQNSCVCDLPPESFTHKLYCSDGHFQFPLLKIEN